MSHIFSHDLIAELPPDRVSFIYPNWIKEIKKTHRSGVEISVLLAEMVNRFWIKDKTNEPIGIREEWRSHVFVVSPDVIEAWSKRTHLSKPMIADYLKTLAITGFLEVAPVFTSEQVKELLCSKTPQRLATYLTYQCEWCCCFTGYLHNHHYPVPRSKGGEETVAICPNCHSEFHHLVQLKGYKLTQKVWDIASEHRQQEEVKG